MARKAIVDKDLVLNLLKEGKTTKHIAEQFGVSRQAIDLHRREFISMNLLSDQRAGRKQREVKETASPERERSVVSLDQQIDLIIAAFSALKSLPKLEAELEKYKRYYENALQEIERLQKSEQKRQEQEQQFNKLITS